MVKKYISGKQVNAIVKEWCFVEDDDANGLYLTKKSWCNNEFGLWLSDCFSLVISPTSIMVLQPGQHGDINLESRWDVASRGDATCFVFKHEADAILFKLRWG